MSNNPLHVGDYGTIFNLTIQDQNNNAVNLIDSTNTLITFLRPDQTSFLRSGTIYDATNGIITYTIASGELSQYGIWSIQGTISNPSGLWNSNIQEFRVERNL